MDTIAAVPLGKLLTVGEVAERSGLAVSALHFYETKGLISSIRSRGNQRRYGRDVLRRLGIIKVAQRVGIPLSEIRRRSSPCRRDARRPSPTGRRCRRAGRMISTRESGGLACCAIV